MGQTNSNNEKDHLHISLCLYKQQHQHKQHENYFVLTLVAGTVDAVEPSLDEPLFWHCSSTKWKISTKQIVSIVTTQKIWVQLAQRNKTRLTSNTNKQGLMMTSEHSEPGDHISLWKKLNTTNTIKKNAILQIEMI